MNKTGHGRYGRYRTVEGEKQKLCNGPLHPPEGVWLPLRSYWVFKSGKRAGKPMSRCQECCKVEDGRDPKKSGYIRISDVWWIFLELQRRLGKAETLRRMNISANFWYRVERGMYVCMRKSTARKAVKLLAEVRANGEVRHRLSIRRGAALRGEQERVPVARRDFYYSHGEDDNERRRNWNHSHPEAAQAENARRREQRRNTSANM